MQYRVTAPQYDVLYRHVGLSSPLRYVSASRVSSPFYRQSVIFDLHLSDSGPFSCCEMVLVAKDFATIRF